MGVVGPGQQFSSSAVVTGVRARSRAAGRERSPANTPAAQTDGGCFAAASVSANGSKESGEEDFSPAGSLSLFAIGGEAEEGQQTSENDKSKVHQHAG